MTTITNTTQSPLVHALHRPGLLAQDLDYHVVRASMVIMFFFGYHKWTGAADLVAVSGLWPRRRQLLPARLGVDIRVPAARGLLGQAARRPWRPQTGTFIATVTIIPFMPESWDVAAGGFPAMTGNVPFLLKDAVRLTRQ
jgi:hypothetical protein